MESRWEKINVPATSVHIKRNSILATLKVQDTNRIDLLRFDPLEGQATEIASFEGSRGRLLTETMKKMFAGVNNKLLVCDKSGSWRTVLESKRPSNVFWHMVTSKDRMIYVQEYGEPPTGIYVSEDGEEWELLITAQDIDRKAIHFHDIAYDQYRNMLITTLGDGNYVKIAISIDGGKNWNPTYKGAWQLLPIAVTKDYIVFGMDSGFAKGGLVRWDPEDGSHEVLHLGWRGSKTNLMQMADLKLLSNGIWIAALGSPQAVIASINLFDWYPVYVQGFDGTFHHEMILSEGKSIVAFSTGESIVWMRKDELARRIGETEPTIHKHEAILERLIGVGYVAKRKIALLRGA
jgi:hypothetical protein